MPCYDTDKDPRGEDFVGCANKTASGRTCQASVIVLTKALLPLNLKPPARWIFHSKQFYCLPVQAWGSTSPHKHSMTSLKEHGNNCRNPDNYSSPWYVPFHSLLWLENWFLLVFWTAKNKRKAASAPSISKSQIFLSPKHSFWLAIYNLEKVLIILLCYIFMFSWIPLPSWATTRWSWYFMSQRLKILW